MRNEISSPEQLIEVIFLVKSEDLAIRRGLQRKEIDRPIYDVGSGENASNRGAQTNNSKRRGKR